MAGANPTWWRRARTSAAGVPQAANPGPDGTALACFLSDGVRCFRGPGGSLFFPNGQQFYTASSGTSHSTPCVTGGCALLRQYFINHSLYHPPSPAMTKAFLMNSARYMTGAGPTTRLWSDSQGMGEMDLGMAFDGTPRMLRDEESADIFTASGQTRVFTGVCRRFHQALPRHRRLDRRAGQHDRGRLQQRLDLTVNVGGNTYKGNVFSGANSVTGGSADAMNNVESVFLPAGVSGGFTVTVTAAEHQFGWRSQRHQRTEPGFCPCHLQRRRVGHPDRGRLHFDDERALHQRSGQSRRNGHGQSGFAECRRRLHDQSCRHPAGRATGSPFPSGPQTYGALAAGASATNTFSFFADGTCGQTITAVLQLQDGPADLGTVSYSFQLGLPVSTTNYTQNFDGVTPPALPSGWITSASGGLTVMDN